MLLAYSPPLVRPQQMAAPNTDAEEEKMKRIICILGLLVLSMGSARAVPTVTASAELIEPYDSWVYGTGGLPAAVVSFVSSQHYVRLEGASPNTTYYGTYYMHISMEDKALAQDGQFSNVPMTTNANGFWERPAAGFGFLLGYAIVYPGGPYEGKAYADININTIGSDADWTSHYFFVVNP
jgi:hypothetical protein